MVRAPAPTWRDHLRRLVEGSPRPLPHVPPPLSVERALERLRREAVGPVEFASMARGAPSMILGTFPLVASTEAERPEAKARAFVDRHEEVFGLSDVSAELRHRGTDGGGPMGWIVEIDQVWRGVPVTPGRLKINLGPDGHTIRFVSNDITPVAPGTSAEPKLSAEQAVAAARRHAALTLRPAHGASEPRLVVAADLTRGFWAGILAWEVRLGLATYQVDALTGRARHTHPGIVY